MATDRFKEWVIETKEAMTRADNYDSARDKPFSQVRQNVMFVKAIVYALLTIAIAIHEAAPGTPRK